MPAVTLIPPHSDTLTQRAGAATREPWFALAAVVGVALVSLLSALVQL